VPSSHIYPHWVGDCNNGGAKPDRDQDHPLAEIESSIKKDDSGKVPWTSGIVGQEPAIVLGRGHGIGCQLGWG